MRVVWAAITANTAVDERASKECLRHQGYASAIQNASNPACSQALAMATVSCTGSMLSCRTPTLNGMLTKISFWLLAASSWPSSTLLRTSSQVLVLSYQNGQSGSFHECSRPLISSHITLFRGV